MLIDHVAQVLIITFTFQWLPTTVELLHTSGSGGGGGGAAAAADDEYDVDGDGGGGSL